MAHNVEQILIGPLTSVKVPFFLPTGVGLGKLSCHGLLSPSVLRVR